jgi:hypothetical protein
MTKKGRPRQGQSCTCGKTAGTSPVASNGPPSSDFFQRHNRRAKEQSPCDRSPTGTLAISGDCWRSMTHWPDAPTDAGRSRRQRPSQRFASDPLWPQLIAPLAGNQASSNGPLRPTVFDQRRARRGNFHLQCAFNHAKVIQPPLPNYRLFSWRVTWGKLYNARKKCWADGSLGGSLDAWLHC